jgi:glycosyltransferase involved in cell wall biosynthesis
METLEWSVVIPAYNAEALLARAVESARAIDPRQILVVDDGSTDSTSQIARDLGCAVISQENAGAAAARRTGLQAVTTPFLVFLDADDSLCGEGIRRSLSIIASDPDLVGVLGATVVQGASANSRTINPWSEGITTPSLLARGFAPGPPAAFMWRTAKLRDAYRSDTKWLLPRYAEDYELIIRATQIGQVRTHSSYCCSYSVSNGKSSKAPLESNQAAEDIRRYYARVFNLSIEERSHSELLSLSYFRTAYSYIGTRNIWPRSWWFARGILRNPRGAVRRFTRKLSRS